MALRYGIAVYVLRTQRQIKKPFWCAEVLTCAVSPPQFSEQCGGQEF